MNGVTTPACKAALDKMDLEKGYSFEYNLYDECYDFDLSSARAWHEEKRYWGPVLQGPRQRVAAAEGEATDGIGKPDPNPRNLVDRRF